MQKVEAKKIRAALQKIIDKHNIKVYKTPIQVENNEKHMLKSKIDNKVFFNYKDRKFFDENHEY